MRVNGKGQVTIPIEVREKAGLLPNTEVEFVVRGNTVIIKKAGNTNLKDAVERAAHEYETDKELTAFTGLDGAMDVRPPVKQK